MDTVTVIDLADAASYYRDVIVNGRAIIGSNQERASWLRIMTVIGQLQRARTKYLRDEGLPIIEV